MLEELVQVENKKFIGMELRTSNDKGKGDIEIPKHWSLFVEKELWTKVHNKVSEKIYALYTKYENDHTGPYSLIIAYEVRDFPEVLAEDLVKIDSPASSYKKYTISGAFPEKLITQWQDLWSSNMQRKFTVDFELYDESFSFESGDSSGSSIWIAVD